MGKKKADIAAGFCLVCISTRLPGYGYLLHRHAACGLNADEIDTCFVFAEIIFKDITAGIAIENGLAEQVADGDVPNIFTFDIILHKSSRLCQRSVPLCHWHDIYPIAVFLYGAFVVTSHNDKLLAL